MSRPEPYTERRDAWARQLDAALYTLRVLDERHAPEERTADEVKFIHWLLARRPRPETETT